ncbi:MAG: ECF transporter S component [Christensenellales bacterium]|jgi:riboflavin transporter FmnP
MSAKKFDVQKLSFMSMLAAMSIMLVMLIHFSIIPAAPFLEYDPADIPILIGAFLFGPWAGLMLTVVVSVIQGLTVSAASGVIGIMMHIFATGIMAVVAGWIYRRNRSLKGAILALLAGALAMVGSMMIWNIIFTPIFMGVDRSVVIGMLLPAILPFNAIKAGLNCVITFLIYKPLSRMYKFEPEAAK